MNIYPGILTDSIKEAQAEAMWIAGVDKIRTVQIDVIDGMFVDNVTVTPIDLQDVDFGEMSVDLHLLTEEPLDFAYEARDINEDLPIRAVIGQIERMNSQVEFLDFVIKEKWQAGLSLDLFTPLEEIDPEAWEKVEIIQLMAIEAGFQGQEFNELVYEKVESLRAIATNQKRDIEIIVDGGVKQAQLERLEQVGADSVVVGSGLWSQDDVVAAAQKYLGDA